MSNDALVDFVRTTATRFGIPGVAVGIWADGQDAFACHGVTSVENPLPIDRDTLYVVGSVTKISTATTVMRLVADRSIELDAPVRPRGSRRGWAHPPGEPRCLLVGSDF